MNIWFILKWSIAVFALFNICYVLALHMHKKKGIAKWADYLYLGIIILASIDLGKMLVQQHQDRFIGLCNAIVTNQYTQEQRKDLEEILHKRME